jgi:hypothetical protein
LAADHATFAPPDGVIPAAARSSASALREVIITDAPASASPVAISPVAIARPMPFDAPVTTATFPSRRRSTAADPNGAAPGVASAV